MNDVEQARRFCSALFGGPDGTGDDRLADLWVSAAWTLPDRRTRWSRADDLDSIVSAVVTASMQQKDVSPGVPGANTGVFLGAGLVNKPKGEHRRAENEDVVALVAIPADVDIAGEHHGGKPYPPDFDAARRLVDSMGLAPSLVIDSGYGLHAWWVLAEPLILLDDDGKPDQAARENAAAVVRDWISTLRYRADRAGGWKLDSVFDLARVMRVPGSVNLKNRDDPRPVRIVHCDPAARYELEDFTEHTAERAVLDTYSAGFTAEKSVEALKGINLRELWARVTSADYRALDYRPEWLAAVLEIDGEGRLTQTWEGNRPDLGDDQSSYDASLVRLLYDLGLPTELHVEAVMCRRLRNGEKIEKVDPSRRTSYLAATVGRIHALAGEAKAKRDRAADLEAASATGRLKAVADLERVPEDSGEPLPPEPPDEDGDPFAEHVLGWVDHEPKDVTDEFPARQRAAAEEQVSQESGKPGRKREKPVIESAPPVEPDVDDPAWGVRSSNMITAMALLDDLLIPKTFRDRGFSVWRLERKDHGSSQEGRLVLKVPVDYDWPGDRPDMYRPGRPLFTDWYKRDLFDTPRGWRMAVARDVMISVEEVGNRVKDWNQHINLLHSYWTRDSSGSDLKTAAIEWLLGYLIDHPAVVDKDEAAQRSVPLLIDHKEWGEQGAPVICFPLVGFLSSVAAKPGAPKGRKAKDLLNLLDTRVKRARMPGKDGTTSRPQWHEIQPGQFTSSEWSAVLEAIYDNNLVRQNRRHLEPVNEQNGTSRPQFRVRPRPAAGGAS
jgi:hypothetical protein